MYLDTIHKQLDIAPRSDKHNINFVMRPKEKKPCKKATYRKKNDIPIEKGQRESQETRALKQSMSAIIANNNKQNGKICLILQIICINRTAGKRGNKTFCLETAVTCLSDHTDRIQPALKLKVHVNRLLQHALPPVPPLNRSKHKCV